MKYCHNIYYNTKFFCLGRAEIYICSYCGNPINPVSEFDHLDVTKWYHCNCEKAVEERKIQKLVLELHWETEIKEVGILTQMPDIDEGLINRIKYEYELGKLKKNYGMEHDISWSTKARDIKQTDWMKDARKTN